MSQLVLTEEQALIVATAKEPVEVLNSKGHLLAYVKPLWTAEEIAEAKRIAASRGPCFSGEQVQNRLKALEQEWERTGGFDEKYMWEFLANLDASDPPRIRHDESAT